MITNAIDSAKVGKEKYHSSSDRDMPNLGDQAVFFIAKNRTTEIVSKYNKGPFLHAQSPIG